MNLSVEHVLLFALVVCAFYYLMNGCGGNLTEGVVNCPDGCVSLKVHSDAVYHLQEQARQTGAGTHCYSDTHGAGI